MIWLSRVRSIARRLLLQAAVALGLLAAVALPRCALAQHHGGGGGFPGGMGGGRRMEPGGGIGDRGAFPRPNGGPPPNVRDQGSTTSTMRGGLQLGPPGRWWDDKHFAKQLHLSGDQQHRMDSIFEQNRAVLLKRFEGLQQEEQKMEALTHARTLDENALFAQIDRVAQARADLEKANTHLLFQIRNEMDADQISHLEEHR
jgi:Spy/CpxP family protein refolding chaperone